MSGEIVIALIVLFFSGAWGAIKFIDEKTDNKFVFFIPALFLSLFLYSGVGEGLLFYACLFAFGPIILMLIVVGIQQGKAPRRDDQNFNREPRLVYSSQRRRPLNLNRELAPSYVRSYDRLIDFLQVRGGKIQSKEDGLRRLEELGIENRFLSSPYVIKVLGIQEENGVAGDEEVVGDDWWESGYDSREMDGGNRGTRMNLSSTILTPSSPAVDSCGHPGCNADVSAFDFRCYTCRNRFCSEHAGSGIDCNDCTK